MIKTDERYFIVRQPIVTANNFLEVFFAVDSDTSGFSILRLYMRLDGKGYKKLLRMVNNSNYTTLGLIINNKLIDTLNVSSLVPQGDAFGIYRNVYSINELKEMADIVVNEIPSERRRSATQDIPELLQKVDKNKNHILY
ncbi:MAG TPA: hypothetical protein VN721_05310 [Flavipsychrobacter sp.]|nr:hypothetical protein [Flavipsychrobacter sp.]